MYSCLTELFEIELTICIKIDWALNNLQKLIFHKIQTTNPLISLSLLSASPFSLLFLYLSVIFFFSLSFISLSLLSASPFSLISFLYLSVICFFSLSLSLLFLYLSFICFSSLSLISLTICFSYSFSYISAIIFSSRFFVLWIGFRVWCVGLRQKSKTPQKKESPGYDTNLHLMMRLLF